MKSIHPSSPAVQPGRHLEVLDEPIHHPQLDVEQLEEPSVCMDCGAVCQAGSWQWTVAPAHALQVHCPACRRIRDRTPAGCVTIEGQIAQTHRDEIAGLARNVEHREKSGHPLRRIMNIDARGDAIDIATTDELLARAIGDALQDAYQGKLDNSREEGRMLRVRWQG